MTSPLLEQLRAALSEHGGVVVAVAFGSVARGSERPDSDVDLAVLAPDDMDLLRLGAELGLRLGREVDIVDLAGEVGYPLLKSIVRDGLVVREGHKGDGARWRSHAIASLETDRPWFERMRNGYLAKLSPRA